MSFKYVMIAFASRGTPPLAHKLKSAGKNYQFAPLADDGLVYTIDTGLWSSFIGDDSIAFCPDCSTIDQAMKLAVNDNYYFVLALTHLAEFDPPGPANVRLPLVCWTQFVEESAKIQLTDVGFDVADQWTGISALTNIGYGVEELLMLKNTQLQVNEFGLFDTEEDALKFASFATAAAPEHAPFVPLKTLVRIPNKFAY
jgi:hypothetical protein